MSGIAAVAETASTVLELFGIALICAGVAYATLTAGVRTVRHQTGTYVAYRQQLARAILLGLEVLVAADIIATVAVSPSLTTVAVLAGIVLVRTFLSFSLEVEIEGRLPWRRDRAVRRDERS